MVLECDNRIIGGIGVMPLPDILHACEIKHFYISAEHRGMGYGRQLFHKMWDAIQSMGYRSCYLESSSKFTRALKFYESNGFDYLKRPYKSGHEHICGVQMLKHII